MKNLIKRIEAADGPDRELDAEIGLALGWRQKCGSHWGIGAPHWWLDGKCNKDVIGYWDGHPSGTLPFFTSSIDAAMTLVPDGWTWILGATGHAHLTNVYDAREVASYTTNPVLALCAAAMKAWEYQ